MTSTPRHHVRSFIKALAQLTSIAFVSMSLAACASRVYSAPDGHNNLIPAVPDYVTLQITDALICPWGSDGKEWDGDRAVSQDDMNELAEALAGSYPYTAAMAVIAGLANEGFASPDPYGFAEIWNNGSWHPIALATSSTNPEDTFHPVWLRSPGWSHVRVDPNMRVRVTLYDEDLIHDDPIGVAEINYDDILSALDARQIVNVRVHDQGQQQILFIGLSVIAE